MFVNLGQTRINRCGKKKTMLYARCSDFEIDFFSSDFDTDEETDVLLQKPYQKDSKVDIPELTQPPVNRSAQVSFCPCDLILF